MGGIGLFKVLHDLDDYKSKAVSQDSLGKATKAPMIKSEFGLIEFQKSTSIQVIRKFNALYGSNTRPKA